MKHKENARYSKYELEMEQTLVHVQVISDTRQTSVEHEMIIIISILFLRLSNIRFSLYSFTILN